MSSQATEKMKKKRPMVMSILCYCLLIISISSWLMAGNTTALLLQHAQHAGAASTHIINAAKGGFVVMRALSALLLLATVGLFFMRTWGVWLQWAFCAIGLISSLFTSLSIGFVIPQLCLAVILYYYRHRFTGYPKLPGLKKPSS